MDDHTALHTAIKHSDKVFGCFVFDRDILDGLPAHDRRVSFIHGAVTELDQTWPRHGE